MTQPTVTMFRTASSNGHHYWEGFEVAVNDYRFKQLQKEFALPIEDVLSLAEGKSFQQLKESLRIWKENIESCEA